LEFHQHLGSVKYVINIIMWFIDMGCYSPRPTLRRIVSTPGPMLIVGPPSTLPSGPRQSGVVGLSLESTLVACPSLGSHWIRTLCHQVWPSRALQSARPQRHRDFRPLFLRPDGRPHFTGRWIWAIQHRIQPVHPPSAKGVPSPIIIVSAWS
jgi:hypothetical protein